MSTTAANNRRTFAIISHPDAGKTTLTEKFLLYGGAVDLAGSVVSRKNQRAVTSDWMELERKRGISVTATLLQFDYRGRCLNLLDTPGHQDFSEDTYRVLTAVEAAVMVVDAGKGIESQTRKLFEVCRDRGVPIFTFFNKLDRPTRDPFTLLDELETVLGISACPMNWPLGTGPDFRGVYERRTRQVHVFERTRRGAYIAPVTVMDPHDGSLKEMLPGRLHEQFVEEVETLDAAGTPFDLEAVLAGKVTPCFFGSAMNNFGVELLLEGFVEHSPGPQPRMVGDRRVGPEEPAFSGFVFKIQSNMNPKHRDRLAFLRVVSGRFTRGMAVINTRTGKRLRLQSAHKLFAAERETVEEALPGDVVGLVGAGDLGIGDTLTEDPAIVFGEIPYFPPECFAFLRNPNPSKGKQFESGLSQLILEGVIQTFRLSDAGKRMVLAAVGPLQFEVVQYRLESEYGAECRIDSTPWSLVRWIRPKTPEAAAAPPVLFDPDVLAEDPVGRPVILFGDEWNIRNVTQRHPEWELSPRPFGGIAPVSVQAAAG